MRAVLDLQSCQAHFGLPCVSSARAEGLEELAGAPVRLEQRVGELDRRPAPPCPAVDEFQSARDFSSCVQHLESIVDLLLAEARRAGS